MRSKSIFVFFVVVFLVSCASPEPQPTVTVVPSSTHTALPTSTETPEPIPTAPVDENGEGGEQGGEVVKEVNMTWEDWKKLLSGPYVSNGKTYPDKSIYFDFEFVDGLKAVYTDPELVAKLPPQFPLLVAMPSGEMRFGTPPEVAAGLVEQGATVLVTKSAIPGSQVIMVLKASIEHGGKVWVTVDENPAFWAQFPLNLGEDIAILDQESGKWHTPGMPVPPKYFELGYKDQGGDYIFVSGLDYKFEDPEHWMDELIKAGYTLISIYTSPQLLR